MTKPTVKALTNVPTTPVGGWLRLGQHQHPGVAGNFPHGENPSRKGKRGGTSGKIRRHKRHMVLRSRRANRH